MIVLLYRKIRTTIFKFEQVESIQGIIIGPYIAADQNHFIVRTIFRKVYFNVSVKLRKVFKVQSIAIRQFPQLCPAFQCPDINRIKHISDIRISLIITAKVQVAGEKKGSSESGPFNLRKTSTSPPAIG